MSAGRESRPRVLVVDDSAFARKVLREVLVARGDVDVVGIARDGLEALERFHELKPDVMTLDLVMPALDGVGVLRELPEAARRRVVLVSMSDADSELGVAALQAGAFDLVHKPTTLATSRLYELGDELHQKVLACAAAADPAAAVAPAVPAAAPALSAALADIVVIGTSTGGPQALTRLLTALPADFPVPIAVALHIPAGYTDSLARRLDEASAIQVREAVEGMPLVRGQAVIARGGQHLLLARGGGKNGVHAHIDRVPTEATHHPSVDVLFSSAAEMYGARVLAVVLTGMGDDGLAGARRIRQAGGTVLAEAAASCVVYGMPRMVWEAGLAAAEYPLEDMPAALLRYV